MQLLGNLVRFEYENKELVGLLEGGEIQPLKAKDVHAIIHDPSQLTCTLGARIKKENVKLLAPIRAPLQDVICLGINYLDHAEESMRFKKEAFDGRRDEAVYFSKRVNAFNSPDGEFVIPDSSQQIDYEAELVVVIGRDCRNVSQEQAMEYIFGYSVGNDISARDLQLKHKQWYMGKSLEGSFPMGPSIKLRDSLDISQLAIKSYVNGELRQNSNTSKMIFDVKYVISELSRYFEIKAGSILSMGTPSGVGMGFVPPRFLKHGDEVVCEIEGIGRIKTHFVKEVKK